MPAAPLDDWPVQKLSDYVTIMGALEEHEDEQQKADTPAAAPGQRQPPSPQSLDRLRAIARPAPQPPPSPS